MRLHMLSFLILLTSALPAQNAPDSFIILTREKYAFQYPKTWTIDTSKTFGMEIMMLSPKTDSLDDFKENMTLFVQDLRGQGYSLGRMGQESEAQIKNMVTDIKMISSGFDSTASPQNYRLQYQGRQGKYVLTTIQYYFLHDEVGYALTMTMKTETEEYYTIAAERIFHSFRFRQ